MPLSPGEVDDDEWLLRRIRQDCGPVEGQQQLSYLAFRPHERDLGGLSLYREAMVSPAELAAWGKSGKQYFVGRIRARVVRAMGMTVMATEDPSGKPGHVEIPELNADNRKEQPQEEWQFKLATLCEVEGPFPGGA